VVNFWAFPAAASVVPLAVLIESFVYPAVPEARVWWQILVSIALVLGLAAAGLGYIRAVVSSRQSGV